jgi:hypothetical protein
VHELSVRLAVVEETKLTQVGDGLGGEVEPDDQVVVVVARPSMCRVVARGTRKR